MTACEEHPLWCAGQADHTSAAEAGGLREILLGFFMRFPLLKELVRDFDIPFLEVGNFTLGSIGSHTPVISTFNSVLDTLFVSLKSFFEVDNLSMKVNIVLFGVIKAFS